MNRASFASAIVLAAPFPNAVTAAATTTRELIAGGQDAPKDRYQYFMYTNYEAFNFTGNCGATLMCVLSWFGAVVSFIAYLIPYLIFITILFQNK